MREQAIKKACNVFIVLLFIFSVLMLLRYSDLPNFFHISFMEKPKNPSNIGLSLYTSFVVTAVFYFFMNYIPDVIKIKEQEKKELPKRIAIQREIQLFLSRYFSLWNSLCSYSKETKKTSVDDFFSDDSIKRIATKIPLLDNSDTYFPNGIALPWKNMIYNNLDELIRQGNQILEVYVDSLPDEVYFYLNYLIKEDKLLYGLHKNLGVFLDSIDKENTLINFIGKNRDGMIELIQTRKCLDFLQKWVNSEYDYLNKRNSMRYSDRIFRSMI